ncbi:hypothetical protein C0J52_01286 [Blattella germanica]|nr:hypothetical protein C0J52_01286 [Blattella germanica]
MMQEILLREDYNLKSIIVFDMEKMSFGHAKQFTLAETKKLEVCYLRGYISRMKALHMVNPGKLTEFMFGLIKGILSKKLASRVYMHGSDISDFGKQVPLDLLPVEYGGKNGSAAEHWEMNLYAPSKETIDFVRKEFDLNDTKIKQAVDHLKKWLEAQPHLPNKEEDGRLERWLINCKNNIDKTKEAIDMYYSLKTLSPEIMSGRDSSKPWYLTTMPKLTPEGDRIILIGLTGEDVANFNMNDTLKIVLMYLDVRLCEDYYLRNTLIVDFKNIGMSHIMKVSLPTLKRYLLCILKGHKARVRSIHLINSPSLANVVLTLVRPFISNKILSRVQIHGEDYTKLFDDVPRNLLPTELGGDSGSINELFGKSYISKLFL